MGAVCCRTRVQDIPQTEPRAGRVQTLQEQLRICRSERTDSHNRHETEAQRVQEETEKEIRECQEQRRMSHEQHAVELKALRTELESQLNIANKEKLEYHTKAEELQEEVERQRWKAEKAVQALAQEEAIRQEMENKLVAKDQEVQELEMVKEDIMRLQNELTSERKKSRRELSESMMSKKELERELLLRIRASQESPFLPLSLFHIPAYKYFIPKRDIKLVATKKNRFVSQCIIAYLPADREPVVQYGVQKEDWKDRKADSAQVLLPITWHENRPNFAGGSSHLHETPEQTAFREFQEEMGRRRPPTGQFSRDDLLFASVQRLKNDAGGGVEKEREVTAYFYGKVIRQYDEYIRHCSAITNGKGFVSEVYGFVSLPIWYEIDAKTNNVLGLPKYLADSSLFTSYTLCDFLVVLLCLRLVTLPQLRTMMALAQRIRRADSLHLLGVDQDLLDDDLGLTHAHRVGHGDHDVDSEPSDLDRILDIEGLRDILKFHLDTDLSEPPTISGC